MIFQGRVSSHAADAFILLPEKHQYAGWRTAISRRMPLRFLDRRFCASARYFECQVNRCDELFHARSFSPPPLLRGLITYILPGQLPLMPIRLSSITLRAMRRCRAMMTAMTPFDARLYTLNFARS